MNERQVEQPGKEDVEETVSLLNRFDTHGEKGAKKEQKRREEKVTETETETETEARDEDQDRDSE